MTLAPVHVPVLLYFSDRVPLALYRSALMTVFRQSRSVSVQWFFIIIGFYI